MRVRAIKNEESDDKKKCLSNENFVCVRACARFYCVRVHIPSARAFK